MVCTAAPQPRPPNGDSQYSAAALLASPVPVLPTMKHLALDGQAMPRGVAGVGFFCGGRGSGASGPEGAVPTPPQPRLGGVLGATGREGGGGRRGGGLGVF